MKKLAPEIKMKKILVFERHPVSRKGLLLLLEKHPDKFNISDTSDVDEFMDLLVNQNFDIVIYGFNEKFNPDLINQKYLQQIPWMVLYLETEYNNAMQLLSLGISSFVSKQSSESEILSCVKQTIEGKSYLCGLTLQFLAQDFLRYIEASVKQYPLAPREKQVAKLLITGMRTTDMACILKIKASTVSTIKAQVFRKMQVSNIVQLANKMQQPL